MKWNIKGDKIKAFLKKYGLALLVLAAGAVLLLWPSGDKERAAAVLEAGGAAEPEFDLEALETKLSRVLSQIEGAGETSVALTVRDGVERVFAADTSMNQSGSGWEEQSKTVVVSTGSGTEEVVLVQQRYPAFRGAVVVCQGGDDPAVRLLVTKAVSSLTGLGTDRITVCKSKS